MASPTIADLYKLVSQAESGNRDYNADGSVVTSPVGAKGRMQVMDPTNANPGYGVKPAADDSLEERARVGQDYLAAMINNYGGDVAKGLAAYNAGPGNLDKALAAAQTKGDSNWMSYLPKANETGPYVNKIVGQLRGNGGGFGDTVAAAMLPSADAAPAPAAPKPWKDVAASQGFQSLTPDQQRAAQQQYFDQVVAPRAPAAQLDAARAQFMRQYPLSDTGPDAGATPPAGQNAPDTPPQTVPAPGTDEGAAQKPQERTLTERFGRQAGLTARAAVKGISSLPEALINGPAGLINSVAGTNIPRLDINDTLDAIGLPKPENATERVAQDVAGAMASGGVTSSGGNLLAKAATPLAANIGKQLAATPLVQTLSAGTGGAASGITRESGGGPMAQLAASLVGGIAPAAAVAGGSAIVRNALRGSDSNIPNILAEISSFGQAGTTPTIGQATRNRLAQAIESTLSRTPGGAGVMNRKAVGQTGEISGAVDDIATRLAPNAGSVEAGESVASGLNNFKAGVKDLQTQLYDKLDKFLPAATPVTVSRTKEALSALNSDIDGAPALSSMFKNGRIQGIEGALGADLKAGSTQYGAQAARKFEALPYESIKKLRTLVGKEIDNANFTSDVPRDKWRALYAALSDDLGDAAEAAGPQAQEAWKWANQFTKSQSGRLEALASVAGKDTPEKVFQAALSGTADGDTILKRVVSAIPKENRQDLAAAVIRRMGRATAGNQNDIGDAFSTNTFLTNWAKLSPEARQTLFGRTGDADLLDELSNLAGVSSNIRDGSKVFANPSGTSGAAATQLLGIGGITSALSGNPAGVAAAMGAPVVANLAARYMTSPNKLAWLARPTEISPGSAPGIVNALAQSMQKRADKRPRKGIKQ